MKKKFLNFIFTIYIIVAVFATICLLSYNSYKVTEFGNKSLVIISDNELLPELKKGDLVIVDKNELILTGHKAFFYQTYNRNIEISLGNVQKIEKVNSTETTYTFDGDKEGEDNHTAFKDDISKTNIINPQVTLQNKYIKKKS